MSPFEQLQTHHYSLKNISLLDLFQSDSRADDFTFSAAGLSIDFSKNHLTDETLKLLLNWAESVDLNGKKAALFAGEKINITENRAVIHPLLRDKNSANPIAKKSQLALQEMVTFSKALQNGEITNSEGQRFTDVVNIGIGGSDLGPRMVSDALSVYKTTALKPHFVANVDPQDFRQTVASLNSKTTLFIVASKSFGTQETLENMKLAKQWLGEDADNHMIAVTSNPEKADQLGFKPERTFLFDEGVGGRYSVWSPVGMVLLLTLGEEHFYQFLQGAADMDNHFKSAPLEQNLPVLLAVVYAWYRNFWGCQSHCILPYFNGLQMLPSFLQQLEMESLGKSAQMNNQPTATDTGGVIWGSAGTMGQHSFYQLLHQGSSLIPCDFIAVLQPQNPEDQHGHALLLANCIAQSRTLMTGRPAEAVAEELSQSPLTEAEITQRSVHSAMPGNRPSTTLVLDSLTPRSLGALIALYEHKVFVLAQLWHINAFDQWGVELGKLVGNQVFETLTTDNQASWDVSSKNLIQRYKDLSKIKDIS